MKVQLIIQHDTETGKTEMALPPDIGPKLSTLMLARALTSVSNMMHETGEVPRIVVPDVRVSPGSLAAIGRG
ncbi:MAG: hypothetical protein OEW52_00130 [Thermoleophilia bacterium]|nr:hypothetical protein [Thermoleophilia bacterium]